LWSRAHTELADKISELLKITFENTWGMGDISDNGKSKHVASFKKKRSK